MNRTTSSALKLSCEASLLARLLVIAAFSCLPVAHVARAQNNTNQPPAPQREAARPTPDNVAPPERNRTAPPAPATNDERAEQIVRRAVEAMGGNAYLSVSTIVGRGLFTRFERGGPGNPVTFLDYIALPDRERTEFRGSGLRVIQVNDGDAGWIYDGAHRILRDLRPEQVEDFRRAIRTSVDNILRGWWRSEGARLSYVGRREAGLARRNEVVRLTYPDGFAVEFEFGAQDGLPAKMLYTRARRPEEIEAPAPDAAGENAAVEQTITEEARFLQYVTINSIRVPLVIDHYRGGAQVSRINYESVEFNRPLADALFARPADARSVR